MTNPFKRRVIKRYLADMIRLGIKKQVVIMCGTQLFGRSLGSLSSQYTRVFNATKFGKKDGTT